MSSKPDKVGKTGSTVQFKKDKGKSSKSKLSKTGKSDKGSRTKVSGKHGKDSEDKKGDKTVEKKEFTLPAYSLFSTKPKEGVDMEALRKRAMRRVAPEGEDLKSIKKILKGLKGQQIDVYEFINLISPYTSDNGTALRSVIEEDLETFRRLCRRVYETMTQDVSDVLLNEQMQLIDFYQERHDYFSDKMMKALNEIFDMAPDFDFDKFVRQGDDYLQSLFPHPVEEASKSPDEIEMERRQAAYHRLQWLRTEGERLTEENDRLLTKLRQLKVEQRLAQERAAEKAAEAETKRLDLAAKEAEMKETLEELNQSIEKSIIENEISIRKRADKLQKMPAKEKKKKVEKKVKKKRPEWITDAAYDIEESGMEETVNMDVSKVTAKSKTNVRAIKARSQGGFQFSPVKTPPKQPAKVTSPFHYSPPKTPPEERRVDETSTTVFQPREEKKQELRTVRCSKAPKDTWGGFY